MHLGIIGYGNIARMLMQLLEDQPVRQITVLVRSPSLHRVEEELQSCSGASRTGATSNAADLISARPDVVVECAGQRAAAELAPQVLHAGIPALVASVGALADDEVATNVRNAAIGGGTKAILPSGAIGGIDLLAALAPTGDLTVSYRATKPPAAWKGTPAEDVLDLHTISKPTTFFSGSARDAARAYPKNANVAATLAIAGAGFDATRVELVADPAALGNSHAYSVVSPLCRFSIEIENAASAGNEKTSAATVYSILREINRFRKPIIV